MAENSDGQERSEEATSKRIQESREKGQIPRSREFNTMVMLLASAGALLIMGDALMQQFAQMLHDGLTLDRKIIFDPLGVIDGMWRGVRAGGLMLLPFLIVTAIAAVASSLAIGGWSFSTKALAFKPEKLNPITGMKRLFALRGLVELLKSMAKFLLIGGVGVLLMWNLSDDFMGLGYQEPEVALAHAGQILGWSFFALSLTMILIAAVDIPFQLWDHAQQLKMTKQEVRDEFKDTEGKPEVKGRIRQMQREVAQRRMMEAVPEADVIITNPTHYAVALKYGADMGAPRVVAKGRDLVAGQIRAKAIEHEVPLFSAPPLARAIYFSTEIDQEIPAGLYFAVAQVLAYIYQLKSARAGAPYAPKAPSDLEVPDEYFRGPDAPAED